MRVLFFEYLRNYALKILLKGSIYKLGKNVLKSNNVLLLGFNKYGVLDDIVFLDKNNINDLDFSKNKPLPKSILKNILSDYR